MAKEIVEVLVEGGKATAAPPLGPALGPLGVNIGKVVADINIKTQGFKGMQVPVKVIVDPSTKAYEITVGTPPASQLIIKEAGIQKGSGNPNTDKVADLKIEQIIKISEMKRDALLGKDNFSRVKEIIGTCNSMGILVEGKPAVEIIQDINNGAFKKEIESGKTELTQEELKTQEIEKQKLQKDLETRKAEFQAKAKQIVESMTGKTRSEIKRKLVEAKIPDAIMHEVLPAEDVGQVKAGGTAGAGKGAAQKK
jgi:large subunit ribosomal protein L11